MEMKKEMVDNQSTEIMRQGEKMRDEIKEKNKQIETLQDELIRAVGTNEKKRKEVDNLVDKLQQRNHNIVRIKAMNKYFLQGIKAYAQQ